MTDEKCKGCGSAGCFCGPESRPRTFPPWALDAPTTAARSGLLASWICDYRPAHGSVVKAVEAFAMHERDDAESDLRRRVERVVEELERRARVLDELPDGAARAAAVRFSASTVREILSGEERDSSERGGG